MLIYSWCSYECTCSKIVCKHYTCNLLVISATLKIAIFLYHIPVYYFTVLTIYKPVHTHVNRITTKCYSHSSSCRQDVAFSLLMSDKYSTKIILLLRYMFSLIYRLLTIWFKSHLSLAPTYWYVVVWEFWINYIMGHMWVTLWHNYWMIW
jgi:hypothetical protein